MAVRLRLRREGTKKKPHYRVVAADKRAPRNGKFIEIIGEYHPMDDPSTVEIDHDRALHWLRHGAQPSSQVRKLLRIVGVWEEFKPGDEPRRERTVQAHKEAQAKLEKRGDTQDQSTAKAEPAKAEPPAKEEPVKEEPAEEEKAQDTAEVTEADEDTAAEADEGTTAEADQDTIAEDDAEAATADDTSDADADEDAADEGDTDDDTEDKS